MEPLNLSSMERTADENRTSLDDEYQEETWHLTEKFPIKNKSATLKALDRKLWKAS